MPALFIYMLKLSVSLTIVFLFYQLLLRKLTFYNWNRWYLLAYTILSFFIPFIDISHAVDTNQWAEMKIVQWVPTINDASIELPAKTGSYSINYWFIAELLIVAGIILMLFRLIIHLFSFRQMMKKADLISDSEMKIYQVNKPIIPFSFGNSVFINQYLHSENELQEIIRHEFVHVKQKHSLDIIWAEVLCLLNWYNPFAWLLKRSIRQNLEFIADNKVLQNGIAKKEYQYLLLKVTGNNQYSIATQFNFSSLKKRIAMMNKIKSTRLNLVKFLFILPSVAVLLLAFRSRTFNQTKEQNRQDGATRSLAIPKSKLIDTTPKVSASSKTINRSDQKNISTVSDDFEITDDRAVIHLKNGETEEYDLKNKEQLKKFEQKYGKVINTTIHVSPMAPVSVVTAEGIKTTIAPISIINTSVKATVAPLNIISTPVKSTITTNVHTNSEVAIANTTVVSPVAATNVAAVIDDYGYAITGNEDILVTITRNSTAEQLEEFKKQMKEKGIELNFDNATFNTKGVLTHISGTMKSANGKSKNTFSATDFKEVILAAIIDGDRTYFKVNVNKKVVI